MHELNLLYLSMIKAWGGERGTDDRLSFVLDGTSFPLRLDDMDVYLPTEDALASSTDKVYFHPACETIISGETEIFKIIRKMMGLNLLVNFKKYIPVLFDIAMKKHKKNLRNDILDMLEPLRDVKTTGRREVADLFETMQVELDNTGNDKRFIYFEIKKAGRSKLNQGKVYYRCKATFPFYNELVRKLARNDGMAASAQVEIMGHNTTLRALKLAVHLFQVVLPGITDPVESYEVEQYTAEAARLCAISNSYALVADDMNAIQNTFRADFDKVGVYALETSFVEGLENIGQIYRLVPPLPYNSQASSSDAEQAQHANNQSLANSLMSSVSTPAPVAVPPQMNGSVIMGTGNQASSAVNSSAADNWVGKVQSELNMGETWLKVEVDPVYKNYLHYINTPTGIVVRRYSAMGNFLSQEATNPVMAQMAMGAGMMPGMMNGTFVDPRMLAMMQAQSATMSSGMASMFSQPTSNQNSVTGTNSISETTLY